MRLHSDTCYLLCFICLLYTFCSFSADTQPSLDEQKQIVMQQWQQTHSLEAIRIPLSHIASISSPSANQILFESTFPVLTDYKKYAISAADVADFFVPYFDRIIAGADKKRDSCLERISALLVDAEKPESALQLITPLYRKSPRNVSYFSIYCDALIGLKLYPRLIEEAETCIEKTVPSPIAFVALQKLACVSLKQNQFDRAIAYHRILSVLANSDKEFETVVRQWIHLLELRDQSLSSQSLSTLFSDSSQSDGSLIPLRSFQKNLFHEANGVVPVIDLRGRALRCIYSNQFSSALSFLYTWYLRVDSTPREWDECLRLISNTLHLTTPSASATFLLYHQYGSNGKDEQVDTLDDLQNPLPLLRPYLPEEIHQIHAQLIHNLQQSPTSDVFIDALLDYASHLIRMNDTLAALTITRSAYAIARTRAQLEKAIFAVGIALRHHRGSMKDTIRYFDYQRYGPNGPDQMPNTRDDLQNPLSSFSLRFPELFQSCILTYLHDADNQMQFRHASLYALLLCDYESALTYLKRARKQTPFESNELITHIMDVSAALKARDGYVQNESPYLLYQHYGIAGKDGIRGTGDDLVDPLDRYEMQDVYSLSYTLDIHQRGDIDQIQALWEKTGSIASVMTTFSSLTENRAFRPSEFWAHPLFTGNQSLSMHEFEKYTPALARVTFTSIDPITYFSWYRIMNQLMDQKDIFAPNNIPDDVSLYLLDYTLLWLKFQVYLTPYQQTKIFNTAIRYARSQAYDFSFFWKHLLSLVPKSALFPSTIIHLCPWMIDEQQYSLLLLLTHQKLSADPPDHERESLLYYYGYAQCHLPDESPDTIWQQLIHDFPASKYLPSVCFYLGNRARKQNHFALATNYYQKIVDDFPKSSEANRARAMIDELQRESTQNRIPSEEAFF